MSSLFDKYNDHVDDMLRRAGTVALGKCSMDEQKRRAKRAKRKRKQQQR